MMANICICRGVACGCGGVKVKSNVVFSNKHSSGSRKMMNSYRLSVSPWIVPLLIWIGGDAPKW